MRGFTIALLFTLAFGSTGVFAKTETAVFAGGCFWCVEKDMDKLKGVVSTISGFAGGTEANPTYKSHKGSVEAVQVVFDPAILSYDSLVGRFLRTIDATDAGGQFCDRGESYTTAIFATTPGQRASAEEAVETSAWHLGRKSVTAVNTFSFFTPNAAAHHT